MTAPHMMIDNYSGYREGEPLQEITLTIRFMKYILILLTTVQIAHAGVLDDINVYRRSKGLNTIQQDERLCALAKIRAKQILSDWSHRQFHAELDKITGMPGVFHENLARNMDSNKVVEAWKKSTMGHNEAMLIPNIRIGCVISNKRHYVFEGYAEK